MSTCRQVRTHLAAAGGTLPAGDATLRAHLAASAACRAHSESAIALAAALADLPALEPPSATVARLLRHPDLRTIPSHEEAWPRRLAFALVRAGSLAAAVVLVTIAIIEPTFRPVQRPAAPSGIATDRSVRAPGLAPGVARTSPQPEPLPADSDAAEGGVPPSAARDETSSSPKSAEIPPPAAEPLRSGGLSVRAVDTDGQPLPGAVVTIEHEAGNVKPYSTLTNARGEADFPVLRPGSGYNVTVSMPSFGTRREENIRVPTGDVAVVPIQLSEEIVERARVVATEDVAALESTSSTAKFSDEYVQDLPVPGRFYQNVLTLAPGVNESDGDGAPTRHGSRSRDFKATVSGVSNVDPLTGQFMSLVNADSIEEMEVVSSGAGVAFGRAQGGFALLPTATEDAYDRLESGAVLPVWADTWWDSAAEFLEARAAVDGVEFVDPRGYFSNTYVPGDPALRLLDVRLRDGIEAHRLVRRVHQPFDEPTAGALALYLHGDRRAIDGPARTLIQIGLQGTSRFAGRRPALNVALVLDAREAFDADTAMALRALFEAFASARQPQDRLSLFVAGRSDLPVVAPEAFTYGTLRVFLDDLFQPAARQDAAPATALPAVAARALSEVLALDTPEAVLGSSSVVLITAAPLDDELSALTTVARYGATAGIPLSVIGLSGVVPDEVERLVLAGQGNRRLLLDPGDAQALVDRELSAVGRVIARAIRLNVRLAPGVRLVEIVGSERVDAANVTAIRAAERSVDRRLSQSMGIAADRGDDGDGIQIVIPAFYAGDSHVILLDVVAPGPGPLVQVDARFKDLVRLRNGSAHASLRIEEGTVPPGPLELNVFKNLLAWMTASALDEAGEALVLDDLDEARDVIEDYRRLLAGIAHRVHGLQDDDEVGRDLRLLTEYRTALRSRDLDDAALVRLADSMRFAGLSKLLPAPTRLTER